MAAIMACLAAVSAMPTPRGGSASGLTSTSHSPSPAKAATYYVNYVRYGSTEKHDEEHYIAGLNATCKRLFASGKRVALVGDADWVRQNAGECATAIRSVAFSYEDLPNPDTMRAGIAKIAPACQSKWRSGLGVAEPLAEATQRSLARIYLSKLGVLCDAAIAQPGELSVLVDAGLGDKTEPENLPSTGSVDRAARWLDGDMEANHADGKLLIEAYPAAFIAKKVNKTSFFGTTSCTFQATRIAQVLAVKGRDCSILQSAFSAALDMVSAMADGGCDCFDEEIVFSRMAQDQQWLVKAINATTAINATFARSVAGE